MTYREWITAYEQRCLADVRVVGMEHEPPDVRLPFVLRGRCGSAVDEMVRAFPELRKVRGHFGPSPHWWCEAPDGTILDPTRKQFPFEAQYVEYTGPDPIGKCMNCAALIWTGTRSWACSDECEDDLRADYAFH